MTIDDDGTISDIIIDSLEFDIFDNLWYAPVIPVSGDYFLILYQATGDDGMSCTVEINTNAGWIQWNDTSNPDTTSPWWSWNFNFPDGIGYYEFFSIGRKTQAIETELRKADAVCYNN